MRRIIICFSIVITEGIITQVIIRATTLSFLFFVSCLETSRKRAVPILKISASVFYIITSSGMIMARCDVILDQSE